MTDLIERLRWYPKEIGENRLMHEAADEIERLDASRDRWIAQLKVLIAEKQRLEAALREMYSAENYEQLCEMLDEALDKEQT